MSMRYFNRFVGGIGMLLMCGASLGWVSHETPTAVYGAALYLASVIRR